MEKQITVLGEDCRGTHYLSPSECALTKALHRAGLTHLQDCGGDIWDLNAKKLIVGPPEYKILSQKVIGMYMSAGVLNSYSNEKSSFIPYPIQNLTIKLEL